VGWIVSQRRGVQEGLAYMPEDGMYVPPRGTVEPAGFHFRFSSFSFRILIATL
jgi:hypothetical protein